VRIKLDENIPCSVRARVKGRDLDIDTVLDEGLSGRRDAIVTQDLDFSNRRRFDPGTHHGLLIVRLPDSEQWRIGDYVTAWLSSPDIASWARCFVVATPTKVRVLRPAS
jgi:hypothetical protein